MNFQVRIENAVHAYTHEEIKTLHGEGLVTLDTPVSFNGTDWTTIEKHPFLAKLVRTMGDMKTVSSDERDHTTFYHLKGKLSGKYSLAQIRTLWVDKAINEDSSISLFPDKDFLPLRYHPTAWKELKGEDKPKVTTERTFETLNKEDGTPHRNQVSEMLHSMEEQRQARIAPNQRGAGEGQSLYVFPQSYTLGLFVTHLVIVVSFLWLAVNFKYMQTRGWGTQYVVNLCLLHATLLLFTGVCFLSSQASTGKKIVVALMMYGLSTSVAARYMPRVHTEQLAVDKVQAAVSKNLLKYKYVMLLGGNEQGEWVNVEISPRSTKDNFGINTIWVANFTELQRHNKELAAKIQEIYERDSGFKMQKRG